MKKIAMAMGRLLSASALMAALSCASSPHAAPRFIPADIAGIVHAGGGKSAEEYALLDAMGAVWLLHTFNWSGIEPAQGQWDFASYDALVDTARANGKKMLGVLAYDTPWIHADGKTRKYIPPAQLPLFLEYVRQTAAHFRGRVDAWCIWNEPNFHFWTGTPEEYFALAGQAAAAVREVDGDVILLGGAFNRGIFGLPAKYIRGLFASGAMEQADAVAFHPYELNPARAARLYDRFKKMVGAYGYGEKIWITEVGYPTGGWYPTKASEKQFPAYVVKTFTLLAARGARSIMWYQLFDPEKRKQSDSEDFFGLVRSRGDYSSKGAKAFALCAAYLAGSTYYAGRLERDKIGDVVTGAAGNAVKRFYFSRGGEETGGVEHVLILWNEGLFPARVRLRLGGGGHVSHDPVSGAARAIPPETFVKVGTMPLFVTWRGGRVPKPAL